LVSLFKTGWRWGALMEGGGKGESSDPGGLRPHQHDRVRLKLNKNNLCIKFPFFYFFVPGPAGLRTTISARTPRVFARSCLGYEQDIIIIYSWHGYVVAIHTPFSLAGFQIWNWLNNLCWEAWCLPFNVTVSPNHILSGVISRCKT